MPLIYFFPKLCVWLFVVSKTDWVSEIFDTSTEYKSSETTLIEFNMICPELPKLHNTDQAQPKKTKPQGIGTRFICIFYNVDKLISLQISLVCVN